MDPDGCDDRKCNLERCPYAADILPAEITCADRIITDCLAYIRHLEAANAEVLNLCKQLEAKCHQLERERDAAVGDISQGSRCAVCRKFFKNGGVCSGGVYCIPLRFEWRGVKEE